jgi:hypothetical protein
MDFKKVYKPPFVTDDIGLYIKTSDGVKSFTVAANDPKKEADNIVALLNDEGGEKYDEIMRLSDKIVTSHASFLVTRGLGHLLGIEKLSIEEAYQTQDDFVDWVISKIKK